MPSFLLCYATGEGQTARVADRVADAISLRGNDVTVVDLDRLPPDIDVADFDAVVVGASIHMGKHQAVVSHFVRDNLARLRERPSAFFQVCLSAASSDEARHAEAEGYVDDLVEATGWEPDRVGVFGGALRFTEYGVLKRALMRRIAREATGDTDTSQDYEYTDWDEVERFAAAVAALPDPDLDADALPSAGSAGGGSAGGGSPGDDTRADGPGTGGGRRFVQRGAVR